MGNENDSLKQAQSELSRSINPPLRPTSVTLIVGPGAIKVDCPGARRDRNQTARTRELSTASSPDRAERDTTFQKHGNNQGRAGAGDWREAEQGVPIGAAARRP